MNQESFQIKKIINIGLWVICLGFALAVNLYFRSYTINFPQLKKRAEQIVQGNIQRAATADVNRNFPRFNSLAKDEILKNRISNYKKANKEKIREQVDNVHRQLKNRFQDEEGQTYLMELDCWHWARYVDNVVRFGRTGDMVVHGKQWDGLMLAPNGFYMDWDDFLYYFSSFLYKVFSIFKSVKLFNFLFYLPLFFSAIFIVLLYIFMYRHGGHIGAVLTCLFMGLAPIFLRRSHAGWFDKDILNVIFPLLVTWAYILGAFAVTWKKRIFWICLASFWTGLFAFNWTPWWFIFLIILVYELVYLSYLSYFHYFKKDDQVEAFKIRIISTASYIVFSTIFVLLFSGTQPLIELFKQLRFALTLNKPLMDSIWPNVYFTVGELRRLNIKELANSTGGIWIFAISVISMLALLIKAFFRDNERNFKRSTIVIMIIWFGAMLFASSRGIRFVMFLVFPLSVCLGWAIGEGVNYFKRKQQYISMAIFFILFLSFGYIFVSRGHKAASNLYPLISDNWYKTLKIIEEKTHPKTVVHSWWDFGDWFKVIAKRRVIFDGQTQHNPQAYWMAKTILNPNEEEAVATLRMLNNGGNRAFEIIDEHLNDPLKSVLLLESLLGKEPDVVKVKLLDLMPVSAVDQVIKILYLNPGSSCFIVEDTMIPKMSAISYLGSWNFAKAYIAQNYKRQEKDRLIDNLVSFGFDKRDIDRYYQEFILISSGKVDQWFSARSQFYGQLLNGQETEENVYFKNGFAFNKQNKSVFSSTGQVPRSLFYLEDGDLKEIPSKRPNVPFSVFIIERKVQVKVKDGDKEKEEEKLIYQCILLDRRLANTLFVRLYFFDGKGLRRFKNIIDVAEGNKYIKVYQIAW